MESLAIRGLLAALRWRQILDEVRSADRVGEAPGQVWRRTLVLAAVWALALAAAIGLGHLEIFLLAAPFSMGVFLLLPTRT